MVCGDCELWTFCSGVDGKLVAGLGMFTTIFLGEFSNGVWCEVIGVNKGDDLFLPCGAASSFADSWLLRSGDWSWT